MTISNLSDAKQVFSWILIRRSAVYSLSRATDLMTTAGAGTPRTDALSALLQSQHRSTHSYEIWPFVEGWVVVGAPLGHVFLYSFSSHRCDCREGCPGSGIHSAAVEHSPIEHPRHPSPRDALAGIVARSQDQKLLRHAMV